MISNHRNLNDIITQALSEIESDFKHAGGSRMGGWHQYLNSNKIGNVATAQALLTMSSFEENSLYKKSAYEFLLSNQIKSGEEFNKGGWSYISNIQGIANTESTCWVLQAIYNNVGLTEQVKAGIEWLKNNFINDQIYNGWGPTNSSGIRVYSSCIVINTAVKLSFSQDSEIRLAVESLKRAQNSDGGWGEIPKTQSTLTHTAHAVIALLNYGLPQSSGIINRAVNWILQTLDEKIYENNFKMGYSETFDFHYNIGIDSKIQRVVFYHMPIVYGVLALLMSGISKTSIIYETILVLMNSNDCGTWSHPLLLEKPLWAIHDILKLFKAFKESQYYNSFTDFIPKERVKKKYDIVIFTVVPIEFLTLNKILNFAPSGKKEDFSVNGHWYYEYNLDREDGGSLLCLITMIGAAGDIGCYAACSLTFQWFECTTAILCGIAAGNRKDINKYSAIISESVVAYEYQRLEVDKITFRPKYFTVSPYLQKLIDKKDFQLPKWTALVNDYSLKLDIDEKILSKARITEAQLKAGTIASGAKLIADGKTMQILKQNIPVGKGIIAAEMEGSGFAPCCNEFNKEWIVFRGISDYGEDDKNDKINKKLQSLAVATAAATMIYFLKYYYQTPEER